MASVNSTSCHRKAFYERVLEVLSCQGDLVAIHRAIATGRPVP
ncbi:hypothetical protein [Sphingomonas sp. 28-62-11]